MHQVKSQESVLAISSEWERLALELVSSNQLVTPDELEALSGQSSFLLAFADAVQQTCFLGSLQCYLNEYAPLTLKP